MCTMRLVEHPSANTTDTRSSAILTQGALGTLSRHLLCLWSPPFTIIIVAWCVGAPGCATVDPRPDFGRAERMVTARTGADGAYNPETSSATEDTVAALLAGGLTTDEAVQVALLNNKRFQALVQGIGVSRAGVVQSGLLSNPSIGLSTRFPDGGGRANLTLTLAQQVADLWLIPVRKRIAEAALEQVILNIVNEANNLAMDARRGSYTLIAWRRLEVIAGEMLELAEKSLKLANDRFEAGEAGKVDVNLARANVLNTRIRLMGVRREVEISRTTLAHTLGLARWREPWTLDDSLPQDVVDFDDDESLLIFAMRERLDAQAAAMKVQAAENEVERQYLSVFPNVTLGVEWERTERRSAPGRDILADTARTSIANGRLTAPGIQSRGQRKLERRQIIDSLLGPTLSITLPIWDQNQAQIARAQFLAVTARKAYAAILDDVARDIQQARAIAENASQLVTFFEDEALPHARRSVEAAQHGYRAGRLDILALLDLQKTLVAQKEAYIGAKRDLAIAVAELRRATGGRLPSESDDKGNANEPDSTKAVNP
jgi:outer membrane protein, heavy metal efflux system